MSFGVAPTTAAASSIVAQDMSNKAAKKEAKRSRDFQRKMSNTAYQRAMKDMAKAGLNPMLVSKVGGASTPPGAMAQVRPLDVGSALQAGRSTSKHKTEKELLTEQLNNAKETGYKIDSEVSLNNQKAMTEQAIRDNYDATTTNTKADTAFKATALQAAKLRMPGLESESRIDKSEWGKAARALMRFNPFGQTAKGLLRK